jgi:peptidoglycan/LPS O-acetylase OafA/YrhL
MKYRADIDGMRAMAVVSVMCYHLSNRVLPGGYIGVDVFFAISGFVVCASLAASEKPTLRGFIGEFYSRRLARIIPAVVVMLLATSVVATLFIPDAWLSSLSDRTARFAFVGLSNWVLASNTDTYFAPRAESNPYTHTWSLGVEEQFYLIFPIICFLWVRSQWTQRPRNALVATSILALIGVISLVGSRWATHANPNAAFYSIQFRFWELAAGALLYQSTAARPVSSSSLLSTLARVGPWLGLAVVGLGFVFTDATRFPYPWAGAAVIGTLLLIGGATADISHPVRRVFASRVPVWIGKRSYSLYLWHWPVYVLLRWTAGLVGVWMVVAVLATILLASASYSWVELPLRHNATIQRYPTFLRIAGFLAMTAVGWRFADGLLWRHNSVGLSIVARNARDWYAGPQMPFGSHQDRPCEVTLDYGSLSGGSVIFYHPTRCRGIALDSTRHFTAFGDSHATAYLPAFEQLAAESGMAVTVYTFPGCPYLDLIAPMTDGKPPGCVGFSRAASQRVLATARRGDVVFLASLRQRRFAEESTSSDSLVDLELALSPESMDRTRRATKEASAWLQPFAEQGIDIIFEAPEPLFRSPPFRCSDWFNSGNPICRGGFSQPRRYLETLRAPIVAAMNEIAGDVPGVRVWDPFPLLCPGEICPAFSEGRPLFFDFDHLTAYGNSLLYPSLKAAVMATMDRKKEVRAEVRQPSESRPPG